jgi:hypothetical protein
MPNDQENDQKLSAAREAATAAGTHLVSDWRNALPQELATDKSLADIKDLGGLAKSFIHAQRLVGSDKIPIPKDDDQPGWDAVFARLGRPGKPEEYEFTPLSEVPEGFSMDPEFEKAWRAKAHAAGLSKKQASMLWGELSQRAVQQYKGISQSMAERRTKDQASLKTEWGQAYNEKLKIAQRAVDAIERAGVKGLNEWLKSTGNGSEAIVQRLFALIGEKAGEEQLGPGDARRGLTPREAESQANRIIEDKAHPDNEAYWSKRHPRHAEVVKKVQGLLSMT